MTDTRVHRLLRTLVCLLHRAPGSGRGLSAEEAARVARAEYGAKLGGGTTTDRQLLFTAVDDDGCGGRQPVVEHGLSQESAGGASGADHAW